MAVAGLAISAAGAALSALAGTAIPRIAHIAASGVSAGLGLHVAQRGPAAPQAAATLSPSSPMAAFPDYRSGRANSAGLLRLRKHLTVFAQLTHLGDKPGQAVSLSPHDAA